jgi:hypothetical protein
MNVLEQFAINMILATLQATIKNPAHATVLKNQLLLVAGDIAVLYGYTLTAPATTA